MWILFAAGSAFFAGVTAILAKCGIRKTDSDVGTAVRTSVVLIFAWTIAGMGGSAGEIFKIPLKVWVFLLLSGLCTGASWLCYFKALQLGDINKVVPIDKCSIVWTILLAFVLLGESISGWKLAGLAAIMAGTFLMLQKQEESRTKEEKTGRAWLCYAFLSSLFAALTSIFGKIGIDGVDSNLGTAVRTAVVLIMAWGVVVLKGKKRLAGEIPKKEFLFLILSGAATGASWLCYYKALQGGPASAVVSIDKLSILVTVFFSRLIFKERLSRKGRIGLICMTAGALFMISS